MHLFRLACAALLLATAASAQEFTPGPENDPQTCRDLWKDIGLPKGGDGTGARTTIVCHLGYVAGHNDGQKTPNWIIERLTPKLTTGDASRENISFQSDPNLPPQAQAKPADYEGNKFDQGHNAPAADFAGDQDKLEDTFFLSNSVPQVGIGFNRSIWRSLETQVRNLVTKDRPVLYVITGPVYQDDEPIKVGGDICGTELELPTIKPAAICPDTRRNRSAVCDAGVAVPAAMYKIIYDPNLKFAWAVLMENVNHTGRYKKGRGPEYIEAHKIGIATIENLTGLTFFTALPARKVRQLRTSCGNIRMH